MLAIPDLHHPWEHPRALEFVLRMRDKCKPDKIISLGDFFDFASFSKYPMNPDLPSPNDELDQAIESALAWYDAFAEMEIVSSNHDSRLMRKLLGSGLPSRLLKEFAEIVNSPPGWIWHPGSVEIESVCYDHGESLNASSSRSAFNKFRQSVVHGHLHSQAHLSYSQVRTIRLFSLNSGALIDARQKAFDYARKSNERTVLACSEIVDGERASLLVMPDKMQKNLAP